MAEPAPGRTAIPGGTESGDPTSRASSAAHGPQVAVLARARAHVLGLALVYVVATGLSLGYDLWRANGEHQGLAIATGRTLFEQIVVTRRWNALHGGVYVPVTAAAEPNPYLEDPERDVVTAAGGTLTKINPAYMTRLISEVMQRQGGTQLHITSLRPIRPQNAPDPWERTALESFERGATERYAVAGSGREASFRYIAPLRTEESCLQCHAKQGYRAGDIRGGISVSIPYAPFRAALLEHYRSSVAVHALFLLLGLGSIGVLGRGLLRRIRELHESFAHTRRLEGLLPICSGCKKIRTEGTDPMIQSSWEPIESYIHERTDADFTHGYCPECAKKYFGRYADD